MKKWNQAHPYLLPVLALFAGAAFGYVLTRSYAKPAPSFLPVEVREDSSDYQFINPLLYLGVNKAVYADQYKDLLGSLNAYISSTTAANQASDVSVYFRDLNTGHWTGINENDTYQPSSMLKVVTLMAAVQLIQEKVISPTDKLHYEPTDPNLQYYRSDDDMAAGDYPVQQLMRAMIEYSDNGADYALLGDQRIEDQFNYIYNLVRLPGAASADTDFMSARSYSTIWRTLYNATLLSKDASNQILGFLTQTNFTQGLVAGVPPDTLVAHKFGEHFDLLPGGARINEELHDCGIVYYPDHPYLICIMTKGADFTLLQKTISDISRLVWDFTTQEYAVRG